MTKIPLNIQTLLLKSTKKCNATCTHCSAIKNKDKDLTLEENKRIIDKVAKYVFTECSLIFHGGEAMLMGPDFYDKLIEYTKRNYPGKFIFSMQSNFLLYNDEWQEIIEKHRIGMSTSYDFFSDIRNIKGDVKLYYDIWYKNIKTFQERMTKFLGIDFYPYIINIVNKQNVDKAKEIYEIGKKEKFNIRHNYFYKVGRGSKTGDKYAITVEEYYSFLKTNFDLYLNDTINNNINILHFKVFPIEYFIDKVLKNEENRMCPWLKHCGGTFLDVEGNGKLYNCSEMSDMDLYSYGNILEIEDLIEITKTESFKKIYDRRLRLPADCLSCKYHKFCQGGCMRDSYINEKNFGDIYGKTWACHAWYNIIDDVVKNIEIFKKKNEELKHLKEEENKKLNKIYNNDFDKFLS